MVKSGSRSSYCTWSLISLDWIQIQRMAKRFLLHSDWAHFLTTILPTNMTHWNNFGLLLGQRRRRWANNKTTLLHCCIATHCSPIKSHVVVIGTSLWIISNYYMLILILFTLMISAFFVDLLTSRSLKMSWCKKQWKLKTMNSSYTFHTFSLILKWVWSICFYPSIVENNYNNNIKLWLLRLLNKY